MRRLGSSIRITCTEAPNGLHAHRHGGQQGSLDGPVSGAQDGAGRFDLLHLDDRDGLHGRLLFSDGFLYKGTEIRRLQRQTISVADQLKHCLWPIVLNVL